MSAAAFRVEEISTADGFARLAEPWDELVRSMPRPSPFLLHGWLDEWWRHQSDGVRPLVHAAFDDGRLVGGLPLCLVDRRGLQVLSFQGGITDPFDLNGSTRPPSLTRQTQKVSGISATILSSVRSAGLSARLAAPGPFPSPFSP